MDDTRGAWGVFAFHGQRSSGGKRYAFRGGCLERGDMPARLLLLPPGLLAFGAAAIFGLRPWLSRRGQMFLLIWASAGALWLAGLAAGMTSLQFVLSSWPVEATQVPALVFRGQAVGSAITLVAAALGTALLLGHLDGPDQELRPVLSAAILLLVAATMLWATAANLVTILVAWAVLDAAVLLAFGLVRSPTLILRMVVIGQLASLLLLAAALQAPSPSATLAVGTAETLAPAGLWITLAIVLRIGAYPLHLNVLDESDAPPPLVGIVPLVSGVVGLGLGLQVMQAQGTEWLPTWLAGIISVGLLPLGYLFWTTERRRASSLLTAYASAMGLLALSWGYPLVALFALFNLALGLPLLLAFPGTTVVGRWRISPQVFAWASLAGVPLTAGFWVLLPLLRFATAHRLWLPLAAITLGNLFLTAGILREAARTPSAFPQRPSRWVAMVLLGLPLLLLGLSPAVLRFSLVSLGGPYWLAPQPALNSSGQIAVWAALTLPWAGGYFLWRGRRDLPRSVQRALDLFGRFLNMGWGRRLGGSALGALSTAVRRTTGLWEGEHVILWTLLFAFVLILSVLSR